MHAALIPFQCACIAICVSGQAYASQTSDIESLREEFEAVRKRSEQQIQSLTDANESLRQQIEVLARAVERLSDGSTDATSADQQVAEAAKTKPSQTQVVRAEPLRPTTPPPETVGDKEEAEAETSGSDVYAFRGGILTPKGVTFGESTLNYTTSSDNRFFFSGVEIVDALIIGAIEARDIDRRSVSYTQSLRRGMTNRIEMDVSLPFVSQNERTANVAVTDESDAIFERDGYGLGDVSFGLHYQVNGGEKWPNVVANVRGKAPTGRGIFDVDDDEAPTGSGYWSVEPSLSFVQRADPVILFGNIGYQWNRSTEVGIATVDVFETDQGENQPPIVTTRDTRFIDFDPGDAIRTSFGMGVSLNQDVNLSFGYDQSYILPSETLTEVLTINAVNGDIRDQDTELDIRRGQATTIGSFLFGMSYRAGNKTRFALNTSIGATDEAPDVNVSLRSQYRF